MLSEYVHKILHVAVIPHVARIMVVTSRANGFITKNEPTQYGYGRRVVAFAYEPHCVAEPQVRFAVTLAYSCAPSIRDGVLFTS